MKLRRLKLSAPSAACAVQSRTLSRAAAAHYYIVGLPPAICTCMCHARIITSNSIFTAACMRVSLIKSLFWQDKRMAYLMRFKKYLDSYDINDHLFSLLYSLFLCVCECVLLWDASGMHIWIRGFMCTFIYTFFLSFWYINPMKTTNERWKRENAWILRVVAPR